MEGDILLTLRFNLVITSTYQLLYIYSEEFELTKEEFLFANFLLEVSLTEYELSGYQPGQLALASIILCLEYFSSSKSVPSNFLEIETIPQNKLRDCSIIMLESLASLQDKHWLKAASSKYFHPKFKNVRNLDFYKISVIKENLEDLR